MGQGSQGGALNYVYDGEAKEVGQGRSWRRVRLWRGTWQQQVTLRCRMRGDCATEGVTNEDESARHSSSTHAQDVARKTLCGSRKQEC